MNKSVAMALLGQLIRTEGTVSVQAGVISFENGDRVDLAHVAKDLTIFGAGETSLVRDAVKSYRDLIASDQSADRAAHGNEWADEEVAACDALLEGTLSYRPAPVTEEASTKFNGFFMLPNDQIAWVDSKGYIQVKIEADLSALISSDHEAALDAISEAATGTDVLGDISYRVTGHRENILEIMVRGSVALIDIDPIDVSTLPERGFVVQVTRVCKGSLTVCMTSESSVPEIPRDLEHGAQRCQGEKNMSALIYKTSAFL